MEHWWSDTDRENVLLASCNFVLRTHFVQVDRSHDVVKYPQVTDVCRMYQFHPTVRWADWTAVLTFAANCSVCSSVRLTPRRVVGIRQ